MMSGSDCTLSVLAKNKKKTVSFNLNNNKVHNMYVWSFAYQDARKSDWLRNAADRYRFKLGKESFQIMLTKINFFSKK